MILIERFIRVIKFMLAATFYFYSITAFSSEENGKPTYEYFLKNSSVSRTHIDEFLSGNTWSKFDPELSYIRRNYTAPGTSKFGGIDGSSATATFQENAARTAFMYINKKCRINTYGDSFTQNSQVNDGETWQEYLAGHLQEPIRNFGVGGYSVYQAYRRMVREEQTEHGAKFVILYIWGDDSERSLLSNRAMLFSKSDVKSDFFKAVFSGPAPHIELDLNTGRFVEKENTLTTPESLYKLTDPEWIYKNHRDDLVMQLVAYKNNFIGEEELDRKKIDKLASWLGVSLDWNDRNSLNHQTQVLLDIYSSKATIFILDKAKKFTEKNGKKLLVLLNDPMRVWPDINQNRPRYDQDVVDYLAKEKFDYIDVNEAFLQDFKKYNMNFGDYMSQFEVHGNGHYTPQGNHLFAYLIKGKIVGWLDPKPENYK